MRLPFSKDKKEKEEIDFLSLTLKEKAKTTLFFILKWGLPIVAIETLIWIILQVSVGGFFFETSILMTMGGYFYSAGLNPFNGGAIVENTLLYLPAASLIIGGCMGGLSRYNIPPKMRIIEPEDQAVTPIDFQIRIRYDEKRVDPSTVSIQINEKAIPSKIDKKTSIVYISSVFKTPPKKAVSLSLTANAIDEKGKEIKDKIRVICDPESDEEDYLDYWEFKREDETFWGKEMIAANKHAKRSLNSIHLIVLAVVLLLFNYLLSVIIRAISTML
jgi:hypothetical protein